MIRLVSVAVGLVLAAATSVHAQSNKPIRSGSFYEDRATNNVNTNSVILSFAQTPTDKYLNITDIDCRANMNPTGSPILAGTLFLGTQSGFNDVGRDFEIAGQAYTADGQNGTQATITNKVFIKVGPGRFPSIIFTAKVSATTMSAKCTIVGNLTDD